MPEAKTRRCLISNLAWEFASSSVSLTIVVDTGSGLDTVQMSTELEFDVSTFPGLSICVQHWK